MSDSQQHSTDDRTENSGGANRRHVLQGIGAAGVAGAVMGSANAQGQAGQFSQAASVSAQSDDEIPTSAQFYSFRESDLSTAELIQECADAGYDAFEPYSVSPDTDLDPILDAVDDTGLEMSSAHISISNVEDNPEGMADTFTQFGEPLLIEPGAGADDWGDEDSVISFAERCNAAADELADHGLEFGHHNHDSEFAEIGDTTGYDIFAENLEDNVHIQLDVGWALVGGRDPIDFIVEHADQVSSIHMKNQYEDGGFAEIDEGDVGMRGVATAARNAADVDYLVYEHDEPENPLESLETGAYWVNKLNKPWQPGGLCVIEGADTHPAKLHSP